MSNSPIATKEETRYFTPRALHRIPVSEYDWRRLKNLTSDCPKPKNWPSFIRSLSLGVLVASLFNIIQLAVLSPKGGYPTWVWVVAFALFVGSATALGFAQALTSAHAQASMRPLQAVSDELTRIEEMFEPLEDGAAGESGATTNGRAVVQSSEARRARSAIDGAPESENLAGTTDGGRQTPRRRSPTAFAPGDKVQHKSFGFGVVRAREGDALVIEFESGETKRLLAGYAPLRHVGPAA